ncbi:MAG TPA: hypothetical protein PKY82_11305 [Pyrinomonadaceae bacterium]|nr:hypothetical protein [Pyrinomonadaceae bacterium]
MRKILLMTILLTGLFLIGGISANAQNTVPPGSYQNSCFNYTVKGNILETSCNPSGGDKQFKYLNKFEDFFLCADDLLNDNGQLKCTKSNDAPLMKKAKTAINAAFPKIYGRPHNGDGIVFVRDMFKTKKDMVNIYYKGLTADYALQYFRELIQRPEESSARLAVIDKAFKDVYGFAPQPQDVAFWNAEVGKMGNFYESIVLGETNKLNKTGADGKNPSRRLMINSVYKKAMGRNATSEEISYWEKRPEIYKQILDAARSFLYSSAGAKDLSETVNRKLTEKLGKSPDKDQIKQAIINYTANKLIYSEM